LCEINKNVEFIGAP